MTDELQLLREQIARLETELVSLRQFIRSLQNVIDVVDYRLGIEGVMDLLQKILQNALLAVDATNGSLMLIDDDSGELVFVLAVGGISQDKLTGLRLPAGQGIAGWVAQFREPAIVEDARSDERFYDGVDQSVHFETKSVLAAPIIGGGRLFGVVEILNKHPGKSFSVDDLNLVALLCRFAGELLHSLEARGPDSGGSRVTVEPEPSP